MTFLTLHPTGTSGKAALALWSRASALRTRFPLAVETDMRRNMRIAAVSRVADGTALRSNVETAAAHQFAMLEGTRGTALLESGRDTIFPSFAASDGLKNTDFGVQVVASSRV